MQITGCRRGKYLYSVWKAVEEVKTFSARRIDFGHRSQSPLVRGEEEMLLND